MVKNYIPVYKKINKDAGRRLKGSPMVCPLRLEDHSAPSFWYGNAELGHSVGPGAAQCNCSLGSCQQVCTEVIHAEVGQWPGSSFNITEKNDERMLNPKPEDLPRTSQDHQLTLYHQPYRLTDSATVVNLFLSLQSKICSSF